MLYDLSGRRLSDVTCVASATGELRIATTSPLTSGVYFVRCEDARGTRAARFAFVR